MGKLRIALNGAGGRMGAEIGKIIDETEDLNLVAAIEHAGSPALGGKLCGVEIGPALDVDADVIIDFSLPAGTKNILEIAVEKEIPIVIGTTGIDEAGMKQIDGAAKKIPVLFAPNMSPGIHVLRALAEKAAALLEGYDVEVVEMHHNRKLDVPSGTALFLAEGVGKVRGVEPRTGRTPSDGKREQGEICIHALRGGDVIGEHTLTFAGPAERVTIGHKADSRALFAHGAIRAARFISTASTGRYGMKEALGLK